MFVVTNQPSQRVAIYARVSTDRQETENQLEHLRRYAQAQGWTLAAVFIDEAESGGKSNRSQFQLLFAGAARRDFDLALVWALDRFTREGVAETFAHIQKLTGSGVLFESYTEPHFRTTGPAGELLIAVAAWIAKQERTRISERVRAGLERAKKNGTKTGQPIGRPRAVFRRDQVAELRAQGLSWPQVARKVGASVRTVRRVLGNDSDTRLDH
jgi:DNA invertase Pin-like site-specific DNA recombinase